MDDKFAGAIWPEKYNILNPDNVFLYCLDELRRGIPEDGKCGHEALRERDKLAREASQSNG